MSNPGCKTTGEDATTFTRAIPGIRVFYYVDGREKLELFSLKHSKLKGALPEVFNIGRAINIVIERICSHWQRVKN